MLECRGVAFLEKASPGIYLYGGTECLPCFLASGTTSDFRRWARPVGPAIESKLDFVRRLSPQAGPLLASGCRSPSHSPIACLDELESCRLTSTVSMSLGCWGGERETLPFAVLVRLIDQGLDHHP